METTFYVKMPRGQLAGYQSLEGWLCTFEYMDKDSCNITLFGKESTDKFEQWAEDNNVEYNLV